MTMPAPAPLATKDRILDVTEKLFALNGFDGMSLRMISAEAGVNLAAVNYHFQSKRALVQAVFTRRITPINQRRAEMLDTYEKSLGDWPLEPEPILEAFAQPVLDMLPHAPHVPMFMVRLQYMEPREMFAEIFETHFRPVGARFLGALQRALPDIPPHEIMIRMSFFMGAFIHVLAGNNALASFAPGVDRPEMVRRLIQYTAAGLRAPAPKEE